MKLVLEEWQMSQSNNISKGRLMSQLVFITELAHWTSRDSCLIVSNSLTSLPLKYPFLLTLPVSSRVKV
jgi:hypothetical protein